MKNDVLKFDYTPAQRIVFALSISRTRLKSTFEGSGITTGLASYWYLRKPSDQGHKEVIKMLTGVRKQCTKMFIDSGIFTMKSQVLKVSVAQSLGAMPKAQIAELAKKGKERLPEFVQFARDYAKWLNAHDDLYDWAFDLDVDQFLGLEIAERFWDMLMNKLKKPEKIVRIWHSTRTFAEWEEWCKKGTNPYLAVEGGGSHKQNPDFYRPYVDVAHKYGKKVHVLAATNPEFMKLVPVDTADSSTWTSGSRFAVLYTPYGAVSFATRKSSSANYYQMDPKTRKLVDNWVDSLGLDHKRLPTSWEVREAAIIKYFLLMDKPYDPKGKVFRASFI